MKKIKNISIIGGGLMGSGIAQVFASQETFNINIYDNFLKESDIKKNITKNLELLKSKDVITEIQIDSILERIKFHEDLEEAVKNAEFIVECIPEKMSLKQDLFQHLETLCDDSVIFATNTSVMSITEIAQKTKKKNRLVGTHFWNPPFLIPLVEVVKGNETSDETIEITMDILQKAGKHPIKVKKDTPGFVANRLQHALWREAISIVEHDIADAATVDKAIKLSFGLRLPVLGPMENADMVGTDLTLSIHDYMLKFLESSPQPSPLLIEKVKKNELGFKSGQGFQKWSEEEITKSKERLVEHLIKIIYNK